MSDGTRSICITVVQLADSDEAAARVSATLICPLHGSHKISDEFEIGVYEQYENDADWMKDMIVALAERY